MTPPLLRSAPAVALWLSLAPGCPQEGPGDPPAVLLDDDDASPDDDDSAQPPVLGLAGWFLDREDRTLEDGPASTGHGEFAALSAPPPLGPWRLADGTPVPGLGLHPSRADLLEGCEPLDSGQVDGIPAGAEVGDALELRPSTGAALVLPWDAGRYALTDGPAPSLASQWALSAADPALDVSLLAPERPSDVLPGPGSFSLLAPRTISWAPGGGPVEIVVLRFASLLNEATWEGLRCVAEDDGEFVLDPTPLAGPYTGDLRITLSRAEWSGDGALLFSRAVAVHASP